GAPILLLCVARPELLDRRSGWGGVLRLEPLPPDQAEALMEAKLGARELDPGTRARILQAAGGNPLFVEEMAAMIQSDGGGEVDVPPTIQALLASRLDQLDTAERAVLERGAVEGELFHQGAVSALTPDEPRLTTRLTALVRKEFVRPDQSQFAGSDAFRFRHLLIRDAAYDALPKAERADLHERFADWLEEHGRELVELDELVGYHLEQAHGYLEELGRAGEHAQELASRSGRRLAAAGARAVLREDFRAGLNLLERACHLLLPELHTARFEVDLGWARYSSGHAAEALAGLTAAAERAARAGNRAEELALLLERGNYEILLASSEAGTNQARLLDEARPVIEADGDEWERTVFHAAVAIHGQLDGRSFGELIAACERAQEHAQRADDALWVLWAENSVASFQVAGDTPVADCLRWLDSHPRVERSTILPRRDGLLAMLGRFDEGRALQADAAERSAQMGSTRNDIGLGWRRYDLANLEGDWPAAESAARQACEGIEATGELANHLLFSCLRAEALVELGRLDEAEECVRRGEEVVATTEPEPLVRAGLVRARVLARRGELVEAELLVREAVARADQTDALNLRGDAWLALAEVLSLAGKDARPELEQAIALFERKGNLVMAGRARARMAATV
ncbi:MAG: hypothetical protein ACXWZ1_04935, partial [Gaiellaceae bacterium]